MVNIKIAGISIQLDNRYPDLEEFCRGYETEEPAQMFLQVTQEEIEAERSCQIYEFEDGYLEMVCIYRKMALQMLQHNVFILHASVIELDGEGYAFLAPSGTGKTTQTRLWMEHFGQRARIINGDKPMIRVENRDGQWRFIAYGTPWCGKEGFNCNDSVALKALYILERAERPQCIPAPQEYAIDHIFRQLLLPEDMTQMDRLLEMIDHLIESVPCYVLRCNMEEESVHEAYNAANCR